ncbi:ABC transporter substrate-binding protein [Actinomadura sp. 9N215]|uniref:ABC transporter substrate-binding protein n=1 Tax=Actinomadura sp. 9N215 TaxID=3375150 RepID=UPI0037A2342A
MAKTLEMTRRTRPLGLLIAALGLVVVAGCGSGAATGTDLGTNVSELGGMDALARKAKEEGRLLLYTAPRQDVMLKWVKPFEEKYGVKVQVYRAASNQVYQRLGQEEMTKRVKADLTIYSGRADFEDAVKKGWYDRYRPATAARFPAGNVIPDRAYPVYATAGAVAWNTKAVPADLQAKLRSDPFNALLDPRLKGKIVADNPLAGGTALLNFALPAVHDARFGWPYLEKLAEQRPALVVGVGSITDSLIQGTYSASFFGTESLFADKVLDGAPVQWAYPKPTYASQFYMAIAHRSPHPYAARLFMEWATSDEAQRSISTVSNGISLLQGWQDERKFTEFKWYRPPNGLWYGDIDPKLRGQQLEDFKAKWKSIFQK